MDNIIFGKFIRKSRKEKGMTQKQLADLLHVSDKTVSKWENGVGFPDIKLLEPLAESLDLSILELMQSERILESKIDREGAEQAVTDTILRSEQAEERRRQMWKVKLLLGACLCGILYLAWTGICYFLNGGADMEQSAGMWHKDPVTFYVWAGFLVILCGAAAIGILWKNEQIGEIKIGRHRVKSFLTILMDMLVVLLLHTYLSNIANNQEQLLRLPDLLPIHAYISNPDGSSQAGLFIRDEVVEGICASQYVKNLELTVRLKAGNGEVTLGDWDSLNLVLKGVNCLDAAGGLTDADIVWNAGEDASFLQGAEAKCIVSKELLEEKGWRLGERINLCQYYYYQEDENSYIVSMAPLETLEYEIAGYAEMGEVPYEEIRVVNVDSLVVPPDIILPFQAVRDSYKRQGVPFFADSASFDVADALELNKFKQEMKDLSLKSAAPTTSDLTMQGVALNLNDAVFINTATHLRRVIDAVEVFFPFLLVLIICAGYLVTLLLLQSRKNEMALLRSLGLGRWKCFRIFFTEQLILVLTGIMTGSVFSVLLQGNYGGSSVLTGCLVGVCYMAGNSLALWKLMKISVMEALFQTE